MVGFCSVSQSRSSVIYSPQTITSASASVGQSVALTCPSLLDDLYIQWYKDGQPVITGSR